MSAPDRQALEHALTVVETLRTTLGDAVVDVALDALRQKLDEVTGQESSEPVELHDTVLAARLLPVGPDAGSANSKNEPVRDITHHDILVKTVEAWGGKINKLDEEGLIAGFGTTEAPHDAARRAILAALDLLMELALIQEQWSSTSGGASSPSARRQIQFGIDRGIAQSENGEGRPNSTDAAVVALELLNQAPPDGIVISKRVYSLVYTLFEAEASVPVAVGGGEDLLDVYVVKGEKPGRYAATSQVAVIGTQRLVGRQTELEHLQDVLQGAADDGQARIVLVEGEPGIGKSRLLHEFEQLLALMPTKVHIFGGRAAASSEHVEYGLIRNLFFDSFGIHIRSQAEISHAKLCHGFQHHTGEHEEAALDFASVVGPFLGFSIEERDDLEKPSRQGGWTQAAKEKIVSFFKTVATSRPATILVLEDLHWADENSLDLIDRIAHECRDYPVLFACSGQASILESRRTRYPWTLYSSSRFETLGLSPLSPIDSRHLVLELFHGTPSLPMRIVEMIVELAGGNPGHLEDLSSALVDAEVLIKEPTGWRVHMAGFGGQQRLPSLNRLLRHRLEQLSDVEREVLRRASVFGRTFWKAAVAELAQPTDEYDDRQIAAAITSLERKNLIYGRYRTRAIGTGEYAFSSERLRQLSYDGIELSERRAFHGRVAAWLIEHATGLTGNYARPIATHFESANELRQAATWYGRAGDYARRALALQTAIHSYGRALSLFSLETEYLPDRIRIYGAMGKCLRWQARFEGAVDAYTSMAKAARTIGDTDSESRAYLGCFLAQQFQHQYHSALKSVQKAALAAGESDASDLLAIIRVAEAWAHTALNDPEGTLSLVKQSLTLSTKAGLQRELAFSNGVAGVICHHQRWYEQAVHRTLKALSFFRDSGERFWEGTLLGSLGQITFDRHKHQDALDICGRSYLIAREVGDIYGMLRCLRLLAKIAQRTNQYDSAERYLRDAYNLAEAYENGAYVAFIANELGWHHLYLATAPFHMTSELEKEAHSDRSQTWLEHALEFALSANVPAVAVEAQSALARLLVEQGSPEEALPLAQDALKLARSILDKRSEIEILKAVGAAWRTMGLVASELTPADLPVQIGDRSYGASDCFERSVHAFAAIGGAAEAQFAYTLYEWALLELQEGDRTRGDLLWKQALDMFKRLDMTRELEWMQKAKAA